MTFVCSNPDCNVSTTGACIDAFSPVTECPTIIDSDGLSEVQATNSEEDNFKAVEHFKVSSPEKVTNVLINVSSGIVLPVIEATNLLRKYSSNVIACVGPSGVGKTTLLASIYEYINKTPIEPYVFAASKTLYSFEQICHLARSASGADTPDTVRTSTSGQASFYHLAFDISGQRKDVLFADRAGEEYTAILDDSSTCENLYEVKRSDTFLLLVDACQLADARKHVTKRKARKLIEILKNNDMFLNGLKIVIVMTRYDKVSQENRERSNSALDEIKFEITKSLEGKGIIVDKHIVAARPDKVGEFDAGYGVKELLSMILEPVEKIEAPIVSDRDIYSSRIFNQLEEF